MARSLAGNSIGTYWDSKKGKEVSTTEGITALCEGLKGSAVTALK